MSRLKYVGPAPAVDRDVVPKSYVTNTLLPINLSQGQVDTLIANGLAAYADRTYVTSQDALNATAAYVDAGDATRLHLSQVGVNNGVVGLGSTGRVDSARIALPSTQRYPKPFWSPDLYVTETVVVTQSTAGTYSWICPEGTTTVKVECWGGGGTGGGRTTVGGGGGGGGGEYAREDFYEVTPGGVYPYTVGAGGTSGNSGGNSFFDTSGVLAHGGTGVASNTEAGGAGGTGSTNFVHFDGGDGYGGTSSAGGGGGGSAGSASAGNDATSSTGASAVTGGGPGGAGAASDGNGAAPVSGPGGGGGGARQTAGVARSGGAGAPGQVKLTYLQPGPVSSSTTESVLYTTVQDDPGFLYKLLVFGQVEGTVSQDNGEYPIVNVRAESASGQIVATGGGTAENYNTPAPGMVSSRATFSTPFTAPATWTIISGWQAVNSGGYTTTLSGNYIVVLASEPATLSASVTFSGATQSKTAVSTAIRIVTDTGTVVATGAQVDGLSGTATVSWTGSIIEDQLYGIEIGQTGAATYASVTSGTFTVEAGTTIPNSGPVVLTPVALSQQSSRSGATLLYITLIRSGSAATVTAQTNLPSLWITPVPV